MIGPGKYDALCTIARELAHARGLVVIVFDGEYGSGIAVQLEDDPELVQALPGVLRKIASELDQDLK